MQPRPQGIAVHATPVLSVNKHALRHWLDCTWYMAALSSWRGLPAMKHRLA